MNINLNIDLVSAPSAIKLKLKELSNAISFSRQSKKGANGWLFFGINKIHGQKVAIKFYDWGGDSQYHAEPRTLAQINSKNVIKILDASFVDNDYAYFQTPFLKKGDLDNIISSGIIGNIRAVELVNNILNGLSHLHSKMLLHRDLKPENILISDNGEAVIGDFGSVKQIPKGNSTVSGSSHSLIYRPPESVNKNIYGIPGDLYQVGIVLYQLLGGNFHYEESSWLKHKELHEYRIIPDDIDKQIFANNCIKERIKKGQIIVIKNLPPWVCTPLRNIVSKACNLKPEKRFQSCSEFMTKLNNIRPKIYDWYMEDGNLTLKSRNYYRIIFNTKKRIYYVEKKVRSTWRKDNSFYGKTIEELVGEIEQNI